MVGVGVAYTDLGEIIAAITPANVIIALMIVIGATIGAVEIVTKMVLYYFHERVWYNYFKYGINKK